MKSSERKKSNKIKDLTKAVKWLRRRNEVPEWMKQRLNERIKAKTTEREG